MHAAAHRTVAALRGGPTGQAQGGWLLLLVVVVVMGGG
jgi:hypothetical protein